VVDRLLIEKISGSEPHPWLDDPDTRVVAALSRLVPVKNYGLLLEAFALADALAGTAKLVIIGDGPEREPLRAQAHSLGLVDRVDFVGARDNPMPLLKKADLFVHSSDREGFGLVIVEALAAGVPVVATDCRSGPSDILAGGAYGDLVPVGDAVSLAAAIDRALANPQPVKAEAIDRYRIETIVDEYERILFHS
jgi:glycosyltransferase involved in cell wall biosynthesis